MNYPDWDPRAKASQYEDWDPRGKAHEAAGFGALAGDIGSAIGEFPTQAKGAIGRAMEGLDPESIFGEQNLYDEWIREAEELTQERLREPGQEQPYFESMPGFTRKEISSLGPSIGMSGVTTLGGLGAGVAAGVAGSAVTTPVGGAITGYTTGASVSGLLAYEQTGNEFLRRAVGMASEAFKDENGRDMTVDEKIELSEQFLPYAKRAGLWEAIPEAASNVLGFKILAAPLKKMFGNKVLTNFLGKTTALYGQEVGTEVITQIGQTNVEIDAGLSDEERRSFDELRSYTESAKEILAPTLIQTTLTAGLVGGGVKAYQATAGDKPSAAEEEKTVRDQIKLSESVHQAQNPEEAAVVTAAIQDEVWAETAVPEEPVTEPVKKEDLTGRERIAQRKEEITQAAQEAAPAVESEAPAPTPAQIEAGNYKKGHTRLHGFDISIENPKGSIRRSHPDAERQWEQEMANDYGYLRGTVGRDKDHVDVFLGAQAADETLPIFVIDQVAPDTGKFDETKVVMGAASEQEARDIYLGNYEEGWQGLKAVTEMSPEVFKEWSRDEVAMQKEASEYETAIEPSAQSELLPAAPPVAKPNRRITPLVADEDSLIGAAAKLGGISRAEAEDQGIDPADFRRARAGIRYAFNNGQKAQSFDGMAETLRQYGWPFEGPNDLLDALSKEIGGTPQYTPAGTMAAAERQQAARDEYESIYTGDLFESTMPDGEPVYTEDMGDARPIFELYAEASKIDPEAASQIFESGSSDGVVALGLHDIIKGKAREGKPAKSDQGAGREVQAEQPVAEKEDLFGGRDETAQAIKDRELERERKIAAAPPVEAGEGALFSGEARQQDLEDITGKPQEKPSARQIPEDQEKPEKPREKRRRGKADRGRDVQRPAKARPKARNQEEALEKALASTAYRLGGDRWNTRVWIADILDDIKTSAMPDATRAQVHGALLRMLDAGNVVLYPIDNPQERTKRREDAAVEVGGERNTIAYFEAPTLRERPKAVEKFLASLKPKTVTEAETGDLVEISGAELAEYNALNNRIGALERVLGCIG